MRFSLKPILYCGLMTATALTFVMSGGQTVRAEVSAESLLDIPAGVEGVIQRTLTQNKAAKAALAHPNDTLAFYENRKFEPYWVTRSGLKSDTDDFIEVLSESWEHGLNPYSYNLETILKLMNDRDQTTLGELDILLTDAYLRIGQDLSGIRVNPVSLKSHKRYWKAPFTADYLLKRLSQSRDPDELVPTFAPQGQTYKNLQKELKRLIDEGAEDYEAILPLRMRGTLRPYERAEIVPKLRQRLGLAPSGGADAFVYDDTLAAEIIKFQRQNGLKADGIIGGQTLSILNITQDQKIKQVIANLERLRWVDENKPDKFVVVNIPSATLWAVKNGSVDFEMPVIVGRKKRPTNIFITEITGVRFNPDWTVPPTIKKDDILPKLQEDPQYLAQKGMELLYGHGKDAMSIDPAIVDWANISEADLKKLRMVQIPGAHNPLGRIRVLMPNGYNIYLHDTNEPHYFERANRAASSGCVRLKDPELMANFIMENRSGWGAEQLSSLYEAGKTRDLFIQDTIPVYLLYYTIWVGENGELVYGNDLYGFDDNLIKMLEDIDGIFIPVDNT